MTLVGDAAHTMVPTGAQAGSQAIVDARVLAFVLATTRPLDRALERYEEQRRPIMNPPAAMAAPIAHTIVAAASRNNGRRTVI